MKGLRLVPLAFTAFLLIAGCAPEAAPPVTTPNPAPNPSPPPAVAPEESSGHSKPVPFTASTNVAPVERPKLTLVEARKGFVSKLIPSEASQGEVAKPPADLFKLVSYEAPLGKLPAYISPDPGDGKKHPAILWLLGGFSNSIGDVWSKSERDNDQSASAYREAGLVMMYPSLRGGTEGSGTKEGFLGEVDDVLAAADFLSKQSYVDPDRVYLGGHSTGGTLAILVAAASPRFRAVFSFGPIDDVGRYGTAPLPFDRKIRKELEVRSPIHWLHTIECPVFVFEGAKGNADALREMAAASKNANLRFFLIRQANHFDLLAPLNERIARKILEDTGPKTNLAFGAEDFDGIAK